MLKPTPEESWQKIATPVKQKGVYRVVIGAVMQLGFSPEEAGDSLSGLGEQSANELAYGFTGTGDGKSVKLLGERLLANNLRR